MGYQKGTPDLFIFHRNRKYDGLAIEFKTPKGTGKLSDEQNKVLKALADQKWDVLASNDLFEIIEKICKHLNMSQLPPKRQTKSKVKPTITKNILEYFDDENEDELEYGRIN